MLIEKTDKGFRCTLSADYLAENHINMNSAIETSPANPTYKEIMQKAMLYAIQNNYISRYDMGLIEICQYVDMNKNCLVMEFIPRGSIPCENTEHITAQDREDIHQELRTNPELNQYRPNTDFHDIIAKVSERINDIYHRNHPEENAGKCQPSDGDITITATTVRLADMMTLCTKLPKTDEIASTVYKYRNDYYLMLNIPTEFAQTNADDLTRISNAIRFYDAACDNSNPYFQTILEEHGSVIVKDNAVAMLANI